MNYSYNKLYFLLHALAELFYLFIPPAQNVEFLKPIFQSFLGLFLTYAFELCEIYGLFTDFHCFVKSSFFREIAYLRDVVSVQFLSVKYYLALVGCCYLVKHSYQSGFSCTVRTEKSVDALFWHLDTDVVKSFVCPVGFAYVIYLDKVLHFLY